VLESRRAYFAGVSCLFLPCATRSFPPWTASTGGGRRFEPVIAHHHFANRTNVQVFRHRPGVGAWSFSTVAVSSQADRSAVALVSATTVAWLMAASSLKRLASSARMWSSSQTQMTSKMAWLISRRIGGVARKRVIEIGAGELEEEGQPRAPGRRVANAGPAD
jgi:hypothetical protein